jgi:hypothetical protein
MDWTCSCSLHLSRKIPFSLASSRFISKASHASYKSFTTSFPSRSSTTHTSIKSNSPTLSVSDTGTFTWDDVVRISQPESLPDDSSDLTGFFEKIRICNRGSVKPLISSVWFPQRVKAKESNKHFGRVFEFRATKQIVF